jgi:hypothetical protein
MNAAVFYETLLSVYHTARRHTPYHRNIDIHGPVNFKPKVARNSLSSGKTTVLSGSLLYDSQDMNPVSEKVCGENLHGHRHKYREILKTSVWLNVALMVIF